MTTSPLVRPLSGERLATAKKAYATHRVPLRAVAVLLEGALRPAPGDLLLARVDALGHHARLELESGRRAQLYVGDEIILCFGDRYAPDQFEALVGKDLSPCHLAAAGGIAATVRSAHGRTRRPTRITPLGLLADRQGRRLTLAGHALPEVQVPRRCPVIAIAGTSMNAGKTTTAASLIRGLAAGGRRIGAAKITGTGAGADRWQMLDAGAARVLDFTDLGYASTYRVSPAQVQAIARRLTSHLVADGCEIAVLEIADGLLQKETMALLGTPRASELLDALVFAAADPLGAMSGCRWLLDMGLPLVAVSGLLTRSPLAVREAESWIEVPILDSAALAEPAGLKRLLARHIELSEPDIGVMPPAEVIPVDGQVGARESRLAL